MKANKIGRLLWSVIAGVLAFLISGIVACYVISRLNNYILATIVSGGLGSLLYSAFLLLKDKIIKISFAGLIGMPIGLFVSFGLIEGIAYLLPFIGNFFEDSILPDVFAVALIAFVFAFLVGLIAYGKKVMFLFALTSGIVGFAFGFLVVAFNLNTQLILDLVSVFPFLYGFDINFIVISISLGIGLGLSNGIYEMYVVK